MISLKDASIKYNYSWSHLRRLCRLEIIPAVKIGRDWFLTAKDSEIKAALKARPKVGKYTRQKKIAKKVKNNTVSV